MAPLKSLPDDQRLVLHLLLEDGRSYAEIAELLSIDRAVVRARTLAAFDTVGPHPTSPSSDGR
jgi:DNA-directed RNA polymerase specialized sigma24 family protein